MRGKRTNARGKRIKNENWRNEQGKQRREPNRRNRKLLKRLAKQIRLCTQAQQGEHSTVNTRSSAQPPLKKVCVAEEIDESKCCVCFTTYEDVQKKSGKDWVMCACSRWLHEECAESCVLDSTGKERLCQLCLDLYVT